MIKTRILLIENESPVRDGLVEGLRSEGYEVFPAQDGIEGLRVFEKEKPDIVLADMLLNKMKGVEFLHEIKSIDPEAKVIVMTEDGNDERAIEVLRGGAINYLKKPVAFRALHEIVEKVIGIQDQEINKEFVLEESKRIVMSNQIDQIWGVVNQLLICADNVCGKAGIQELRLGLYEIIINAIEHGNLEISFEEKCDAIERNNYEKLLKKRLSNQAYSQRRVTIDYHMIPGELHYVIRDGGKGFDWRHLPCPDPYGNLLSPCGRGILLACIYLDRVEFNDKGNEVHLVKYGNGDGKKKENKSKRG